MQQRLVKGMASLILSLFLMEVGMTADKETTYEYDGIHSIRIDAIVGDIDIRTHSRRKLVVKFKNDLEKPEILTVESDTGGGRLVIKESFTVNPDNDPEGKTSWTVLLPKATAIQSIECFSARGDMSFEHFKADFIKCHAASGKISVDFVHSEELVLSTTSGSIVVDDCEISELGKMVSSHGKVEIHLPHLPSTRLDASSSFGSVLLSVPSFGDNFRLTTLRNADQSRISIPYECTRTSTKRYHKDDIYLTDRCVVNHGTGGPEVKLLTGSGTIEILSESSFRD